MIKDLQAEVQQLHASLDWPRSRTGCQTDSPALAEAHCQAVPHSMEASQQTAQNQPSCSAASQTEAVRGLSGWQGAQQQQQQERASVSVDTQTEPR